MVSSEVQRTLVKSPPELWAELSDPAALARHLGELGEIRIVETKPEERVEWESDGATGTVSIKPSGWGTKVTLSVTRELDQAPALPTEAQEEDAQPAEPQAPIDEPTAALEVEPPTAAEAGPPPAPEIPPESPEPVAAAEVVPDATTTVDAAPPGEPEFTPRRGFFSRLFRRRAQPVLETSPTADTAQEPAVQDPEIAPTPQPEVISAPEPEASAPPEREPETVAIPTPEPQSSIEVEQADDLAAELQMAEEVAAEEVTAILTAALDRLGAAHHRPFSRS